jgi:hypothetical protein
MHVCAIGTEYQLSSVFNRHEFSLRTPLALVLMQGLTYSDGQ